MLLEKLLLLLNLLLKDGHDHEFESCSSFYEVLTSFHRLCLSVLVDDANEFISALDQDYDLDILLEFGHHDISLVVLLQSIEHDALGPLSQVHSYARSEDSVSRVTNLLAQAKLIRPAIY